MSLSRKQYISEMLEPLALGLWSLHRNANDSAKTL